MWQLSQSFCLCPARSSPHEALSRLQVLEQMYGQLVSGQGGRMHTLMSKCFTRTHPPTNPGPLQVCSRHTKPGSASSMRRGSWMSTTGLSHHWSSPRLDLLAPWLTRFYSDWQANSRKRTAWAIRQLLPGFVAGFRSPFSVGPFCVFAEAALAKGVQHTIPSESWQSSKADWTCIEAHTEYGIMTAHTENQWLNMQTLLQYTGTSDRTPCHHMQHMQVLEFSYFLLITEVQPCLQSLELSHV